MRNSPYLDKRLRSYAEAHAVIARGPYAPLLADHQPDILYQGDNVRRGRKRAADKIAFLTQQIAIEVGCIAQAADERRKAKGRIWVAEAQAARRGAMRERRAYDEVMGL